MSDEGLPQLPPQAPPRPGGRLATAAGQAWKVLNSGIAIAMVSGIAVLLLTKCYESNQARSADLAKRRTDLERLLVELELRKDRLWVVCEQSLPAYRKAYNPLQQANNGKRAKAIVAGRSDTVTSDPAYQNFHLATLLSQAEMTAGLVPAQQKDLMEFTDLTDDGALGAMPDIFDKIRDPIETLELQLNSGQIPISQTENQARAPAAPAAATPQHVCYDAGTRTAAPAPRA
jgi:hypothetical protein